MKSETVVDKNPCMSADILTNLLDQNFSFGESKMSSSNEPSWTEDELRMAKFLWDLTTFSPEEMASAMQRQHDSQPFIERPIDISDPFKLERHYTEESMKSMDSMIRLMGGVDEPKMPRNIDRAEGQLIFDLCRDHALTDVAAELNERFQTQDFTKRAVADYMNQRHSPEDGQSMYWGSPEHWPGQLITVFLACYYDPGINRTSCRDMVDSLTQMLKTKFPARARMVTTAWTEKGIVLLSKRAYIRPVAATVGHRTGFLPDLIVRQSPDLRLILVDGYPEKFNIVEENYRFG